MNNEKASITAHSDGNRLYLVPETYLQNQMNADSSGHSQFIANGEGAKIRVSRVLEYGMETWHPVAMGVITLPDGRVLPFEAEWHNDFFDQVRSN